MNRAARKGFAPCKKSSLHGPIHVTTPATSYKWRTEERASLQGNIEAEQAAQRKREKEEKKRRQEEERKQAEEAEAQRKAEEEAAAAKVCA